MTSVEEFESLPPNAFVRLPVVLKLLGVSRTHFYLGMQKGRYPRPVKLGAKISAWRKSEIIALQKRLEAARR